MGLYKPVFRPLAFSLDPESAHHLLLSVTSAARALGILSVLQKTVPVRSGELEATVAGIRFPNRVGLAAGFDKDAGAVELFAALGFGHVEVGTVTPLPQPGNPRPRIFRYPADSALINRMGFPSIGAEAVRRRLETLRSKHSMLPVLGVNIGKNKDTDIEGAAADYVRCFEVLAPLADYIAINVSSPNTKDLRQLQGKDRLSQLLAALSEKNARGVPIFVKIAPDVTWGQLDELLDACVGNGVAGVIATNTTLSRDGLSTSTEEVGGLSGRPLFSRARDVVAYAAKQAAGKLAIVGAGGVFGVDEYRSMIQAGAQLVQVYTGLIYEGPLMIRAMLRNLARSS